MLKKIFFLIAKSLLLLAVFLHWGSGFAQTKEEAAQLRQKLQVTRSDNTDKVETLLKLGRYILFKEGEYKADLDSAQSYCNAARRLSMQLRFTSGLSKSMLLDSQIAREKGDRARAWSLAGKALIYAASHKFYVNEAEVYIEMGQHFGSETGQLEKKISYFEKAVPLFLKGKDYKQAGNALKDLGEFYQIAGDYNKSIALLQQALQWFKKAGYKDMQITYILIATHYRLVGNYNAALEYGLLAEKTANFRGDESMQRCTIYNHLALIYYELKNNKKAIEYFEMARDVAVAHKDKPATATLQANIAALAFREKQFGKTISILDNITKEFPPQDFETKVRLASMYVMSYSRLGQYKKAKVYYEQLLAFEKLQQDTRASDDLYRAVIAYQQLTGQSEQTYPYLEKLKQNHIGDSNLIRRYELEQLYYRSDSATGKLMDAIGHLKRYKTLNDSVFNINKEKQLSALQLQFDTDKKDKDIKLLQKQSELQNARIASDKAIRYIFIGSLVVLIMFLALVYNRYRLKQRSNRRLESQQEEINAQNELLRKLLVEKEWLLKEIHHRVKNNLQIVISLLNTQSAYLDNEDALLAIQNSQHRMHAMSLIHQKLYQSDNMSSIDMSWYIHELAGYLKDSFDNTKRISYKLETERVELDVAQAVPLGLILNEAISNAIKYAFPNELKGQVLITLKKTGPEHYMLSIADNGVGLPEGFDIENTDSLGMNLMMGLAAQLDGTFNITSENGLTVSVVFHKNEQLGQVEETLINKNE